MASSFITINDQNGFWVKDALFECLCSYLAQVIKTSELEKPEWLISLSDIIKKNSLGLYPSYMHLELEDYLIDDERKALFVKFLDITKQALIAKGDFIDIEELNSFVVDKTLQPYWSHPLEISRLIKILDYIKMLIDGQITIKVDDPIDYEF
jgi:hypothetical protein